MSPPDMALLAGRLRRWVGNGCPTFPAASGHGMRALAIEVGLALLSFTALTFLTWRYADLGEDAYSRRWLVLEPFREPRFLFTSILPALVLFVAWRRTRWSAFEDGREVRWFVFAVCAASSWTFSTYEFNLYVGQPHHLQRLILLLCPFLVLWHPAFATVYAILGAATVHQFHHPLLAFTWLDKRILFNVLLLFSAFLYLSLVRRQRLTIFLGLTAATLAANYVYPGLAKIRTDWALHNDLTHLATIAHANGWLRMLDTDAFLAVLERFHWLNKPLIYATLATELGALCFLLHRRIFIALVLATVGLHLGIFLSSGICFWKWVLLNLGTLLAILRLPTASKSLLFSRPFWMMSLIAIATAPWNARPSWLMWYDTPYDEFFEVYAIGESGERYHVDRGFLAPFDVIFAQNRFQYLTEVPMLVGTFGATPDRRIHRALVNARSAGEVTRVRDEFGRSRYDARMRARFTRFIQQYFGRLNQRGDKHWWLSRLTAPHHIWSQALQPSYELQEPVLLVEVELNRVWFDGDSLRTLETRVIEQIPISADLAAGEP